MSANRLKNSIKNYLIWKKPTFWEKIKSYLTWMLMVILLIVLWNIWPLDYWKNNGSKLKIIFEFIIKCLMFCHAIILLKNSNYKNENRNSEYFLVCLGIITVFLIVNFQIINDIFYYAINNKINFNLKKIGELLIKYIFTFYENNSFNGYKVIWFFISIPITSFLILLLYKLYCVKSIFESSKLFSVIFELFTIIEIDNKIYDIKIDKLDTLDKLTYQHSIELKNEIKKSSSDIKWLIRLLFYTILWILWFGLLVLVIICYYNFVIEKNIIHQIVLLSLDIILLLILINSRSKLILEWKNENVNLELFMEKFINLEHEENIKFIILISDSETNRIIVNISIKDDKLYLTFDNNSKVQSIKKYIKKNYYFETNEKNELELDINNKKSKKLIYECIINNTLLMTKE